MIHSLTRLPAPNAPSPQAMPETDPIRSRSAVPRKTAPPATIHHP